MIKGLRELDWGEGRVRERFLRRVKPWGSEVLQTVL